MILLSWIAENGQLIFNVFLGTTTAYVAYQQWQTNRIKLSLDLYDRRLKIYQETQKTIRQVASAANISVADLFAFHAATAEADFLFQPEIRDYLDEIFRHGSELRSATAQFRDATQPHPSGYDHDRICKVMTAELEWFTNQHGVAKGRFARYLSLGNIKGTA